MPKNHLIERKMGFPRNFISENRKMREKADNLWHMSFDWNHVFAFHHDSLVSHSIKARAKGEAVPGTKSSRLHASS
jgi:hypothetical protein